VGCFGVGHTGIGIVRKYLRVVTWTDQTIGIDITFMGSWSAKRTDTRFDD
jgi:hypothetical protein